MMWLLDWPEIPTLLLALSGLCMFLFEDRRVLIGLLAGEYILSFWLMLTTIPIVDATALLLAGALAVVILGLSANVFTGKRDVRRVTLPGTFVFRFSAGAIGILAAVGTLRAEIVQLSDLNKVYTLGGLILILTDFLQLGLTTNEFRIGMGLLGLMTGFSLLYTAVEPSLAVVALLAVVHLGIALTVSYAMLQSDPFTLVKGGRE